MNAEPPVPGLYLAALAALSACALLSWVFVWRYRRVRWKHTAEGRHLMRFTIILGLTFTASALLQFVAVSPLVRVSLSLFLFGCIAAELYTRNVLLHEAQREHDDGG